MHNKVKKLKKTIKFKCQSFSKKYIKKNPWINNIKIIEFSSEIHNLLILIQLFYILNCLYITYNSQIINTSIRCSKNILNSQDNCAYQLDMHYSFIKFANTSIVYMSLSKKINRQIKNDPLARSMIYMVCLIIIKNYINNNKFKMGNSCMKTNNQNQSYLVNFELNIRIQSMKKQKDHLFNYGTQEEKHEENLSIQENGVLIKYQNGFQTVTSLLQFSKLQKKFIRFFIDFVKIENQIHIFRNNPCDDGLHFGNLWLVIKKDKKIELKIDDTIKLGKLRFKLIEIALNEQKQLIQEESIKFAHEEDNNIYCKICYEKTSDTENPLITPCACTGSVQYVHLYCIRQWLQKISNSYKTPNSMIVIIQKHICQICNDPIKQKVTHEGIQYFIFYAQDKLKKPYITLHLLEKDSDKTKAICMFSFQNIHNTFIGRSNNCGIKLVEELSLSRQHSQLTFQNNKLYINDMNSRYGTLKLIKQPLIIEAKTPSNDLIQIGSHVLSLNIKVSQKHINKLQRFRTEKQVNYILKEYWNWTKKKQYYLSQKTQQINQQ